MRVPVLIALLAAAAGCKKSEESQPAGQTNRPPEGPAITSGETELGKKACNGYVAQVCKCAETTPELKEECQMATARPQAFEMNARAALATGDATTKDRTILIANARKIMSSCIEDSAALVKEGCPMAAPAPAATPAPAVPAPAPAK
jgi:hypothetical protein